MFIINYFLQNKGKHITAEEIYNNFLDNNIKIGMATVYRNLKSIEEDGIIIKYGSVDGGPTCYEYHTEQDNIKYHFKCEKCGILLHLQCDRIDFLNKHMEENHKFKINKTRTVFYGICENCC